MKIYNRIGFREMYQKKEISVHFWEFHAFCAKTVKTNSWDSGLGVKVQCFSRKKLFSLFFFFQIILQFFTAFKNRDETQYIIVLKQNFLCFHSFNRRKTLDQYFNIQSLICVQKLVVFSKSFWERSLVLSANSNDFRL